MKFNGIQVLRTIAALAVVLSHTGSFSIQILGLESAAMRFLSEHGIFRFSLVVFFAVSGFVMAHAIRGAKPGEFLVFRALRVFPTLWIAALGVLAFKLVAFRHYPEGPGAILAGLFLLPLGDRAHHLLGVEWTLVYELFFYASIASFVWLGGRKCLLIGCGIWLAAVAVRCVIAPGWGTTERPEWFHVPLSGWHIPTLMGVFAYALRERYGALPFGTRLAAFAFLANSFVLPATAEGWLAMQAVAGALFVWWFADYAIDENHFMVKLGDASYGIYLLHAQIISVFLAVAHKHGLSVNGPWVLPAAAFTLALALGYGYGVFETRLYHRLRKRLKRRMAPPQQPLRIAA